MLLGQTRCQRIRGFCVGVGGAFINHYWPVFVQLVKQSVLRLAVADMGSRYVDSHGSDQVGDHPAGGAGQLAARRGDNLFYLLRMGFTLT
jgi:hypothetical protein